MRASPRGSHQWGGSRWVVKQCTCGREGRSMRGTYLQARGGDWLAGLASWQPRFKKTDSRDECAPPRERLPTLPDRPEESLRRSVGYSLLGRERVGDGEVSELTRVPPFHHRPSLTPIAPVCRGRHN
eukprot:GHVU01187075.1.p2 GENE.GHVU01187075.1~~GHVU01187075.1.p2  ORF type:complete len:127 (-),score=2.73 GHVU01187075.1:317-697(-)